MSDAPEEIGLVGNGLEWRLWNRHEDSDEQYAVRYILRDKHEAELSALKKQVEELTKALEPFVALADKRDAHYRRRGGNCDNFPATHPSYDIDAGKRELPMGAWRAARAALASTRETSE